MCCHQMINAGFWGDSACFIKHFHAGFSAPPRCSKSDGTTQYPCEIPVPLLCLYMLYSFPGAKRMAAVEAAEGKKHLFLFLFLFLHIFEREIGCDNG